MAKNIKIIQIVQSLAWLTRTCALYPVQISSSKKGYDGLEMTT